MLEIKDLSIRYGKESNIIENFSLTVNKGEIVTIAGESGSGKSESGCDRGRGKRLLHHDRNPLCVNALPGT